MALDLNKFRGDAAQEAEYGFRSFAWQNQRVRGGEGQKDRPAAEWWLWRRKLDARRNSPSGGGRCLSWHDGRRHHDKAGGA
jgi:hypothetical protein